jgi:TPR repeat protein
MKLIANAEIHTKPLPNWFGSRVVLLAALLLCAGIQLHAQRSEADRKLLADIRAKAEKGDAESQNELGCAFLVGNLGVPKDVVEAVKWYRKAAGQDYAKAQCNLGACYAKGEGVGKDEAEAVKWYREAAENHLAEAQNNLGVCYDKGQGVTKNELEAVKWYRKAAEQGYATAQSNLGACYGHGQGVAKDEAEAVKWYREAAENHLAEAQYNLGVCYAKGEGVGKDEAEAVKWYRKAAEQGFANAQYNLGLCYAFSHGVAKDVAVAVQWYRLAAEQHQAKAQFNLSVSYAKGEGVTKDLLKAVRWCREAAEQDYAEAQYNMGLCYAVGQGVAKDEAEAVKWFLLAAEQGHELAKKNMAVAESQFARERVAEGRKLARNFKPREFPSARSDTSSASIAQVRQESSGSGFFITEDGYLITNEHVTGNGAQVRLVTGAGLISAKVVKVDAANDLALLKAEGNFTPLPITASRGVRLGSTVATVGFPNIGLQGFAPKLAKGEIAALSGAQDDARYFQISVPVQPGNSGGALVDERGNVVGVVSAKLNAATALSVSGALPENVNYAVKSSFLLSFLESVPEVSAKLKEPSMAERKFEDVVKSAEQAAVLVLVY